MERLTDKHEADAQRKEYERRLANGYPRNIPEERFLRLAAYEDTHMMPADVMSMRMDMAIITALFHDCDVDRMRELAEADRDGRLVVLPCKPGDTVYSIFGAEVIEKTVGRVIINGYTSPRIWVDLDCSFLSSVTTRWDLGIGKDFFLTREEAEKALEAMKNVYT